MRVTVEIDDDDVFHKLDSFALANQLIRHKDWHKQLEHALTMKNKETFTCEFDGVCEYSMKDVIENYKQGKDISHYLKAISYEAYGLVI